MMTHVGHQSVAVEAGPQQSVLMSTPYSPNKLSVPWPDWTEDVLDCIRCFIPDWIM